MSTAPAIGIDLGTTYSCIAAFRNDKHEIIKTDKGLTTMASFVSFTRQGRLIGDDAKENSIVNPRTTIFDVKRFIGRRFDDPIFQEDLKTYPFEIIDEDGNPKIKVQHRGDDKIYWPEEISAMILEKLKDNAEKHFECEIQKAVITVPAHFNDSQRQATKDAGRIAGLEVLRIINEPTAAALAYGIHDKYAGKNDPCNILVYDLGGGTFDVSIITIEDGIFVVKATNGDTHLGGNDIDLRLLDYFAQEFQQKHNIDLKTDKRAVRRLRMQCEKLKQSLSTTALVPIDIDTLYEDIDFYSSMHRTTFETLCEDIFKKSLDCVQETINDAKMTKEDIHEIILIGGSTRIPQLRMMLQTFFNGKELNLSLNPDEAVAIGASIQAAILQGIDSEVIGSLLLMDVNPLSLGIEVIGGRMSVIIPRNTQIPVSIDKEYTTVCDNQTNIRISIYEGERQDITNNYLLGEFMLTGIKSAKRGEAKVIVTFEVNTNGILHVTALEKNENNSNSLNIEMNKCRLSDEQLKMLIANAENNRNEDMKWAKAVESRIYLQNYCRDTWSIVKDELSRVISREHREIIETKCDQTLKWIERNMNKSKDDYDQKLKEVLNMCKPIIKAYK